MAFLLQKHLTILWSADAEFDCMSRLLWLQSLLPTSLLPISVLLPIRMLGIDKRVLTGIQLSTCSSLDFFSTLINSVVSPRNHTFLFWLCFGPSPKSYISKMVARENVPPSVATQRVTLQQSLLGNNATQLAASSGNERNQQQRDTRYSASNAYGKSPTKIHLRVVQRIAHPDTQIVRTKHRDEPQATKVVRDHPFVYGPLPQIRLPPEHPSQGIRAAGAAYKHSPAARTTPWLAFKDGPVDTSFETTELLKPKEASTASTGAKSTSSFKSSSRLPQWARDLRDALPHISMPTDVGKCNRHETGHGVCQEEHPRQGSVNPPSAAENFIRFAKRIYEHSPYIAPPGTLDMSRLRDDTTANHKAVQRDRGKHLPLYAMPLPRHVPPNGFQWKSSLSPSAVILQHPAEHGATAIHYSRIPVFPFSTELKAFQSTLRQTQI